MNNNEDRYHNLFENSPIAMLEEDFSELKAELDKLRTNGVTDFHGFINDHPEFLGRAVQLVQILDANQAMIRLYEAREKSEVVGNLEKFMPPENFKEELVAYAEGRGYFEREVAGQTLQGERLDLLLTVKYYTDAAGHHKALVHMTDITVRKRAEDRKSVV